MDQSILNEIKELSLAGNITFPEVVKRLIANNIERYTVDLLILRMTYFGNDNTFYDSSLKLDIPEVAKEFNTAEIRNTIKDTQQSKIDYQTFLRRIMLAGCTHYEVFIAGKKVIYFGRDGSNHIEVFPSAQ